MKPSLQQLCISVTYRCNAKCLACREWQTPQSARKKDLSLTQYQKILKSWSGEIPFISFVGGEAYLRPDLVKIVIAAVNNFQPKVINLATNGLTPNKITSDTQAILAKLPPKTTLMVNLSIDGVGRVHNHCRGDHHAFTKLKQTHQNLKKIQVKHPKLKIAFHTGVSVFNHNHLPALMTWLLRQEPDSYFFEVCHDRTELLKEGVKIQPSTAEWQKIIVKTKKLFWRLNHHAPFWLRLIRLGYYPFSLETMVNTRQVFPCRAGEKSIFLDPYGKLSACELRKPFANLKKFAFNLQRAYYSTSAEKERAQIKDNQCFCHTSYYYYSSIAYRPDQLLKYLIQWQSY